MWTQSHWLWAGIYISINLYTASCALFQEFKDPWTDWHKYWQRPRFYNTTSERKTPRLCDNGIKITEQKAKVYWGEPNNSVPYNKWQCLHEKCEVFSLPSIFTTSFYNKESFNFDTLLVLFIDLFRKWRLLQGNEALLNSHLYLTKSIESWDNFQTNSCLLTLINSHLCSTKSNESRLDNFHTNWNIKRLVYCQIWIV